jgi:ABC-type uncharacterized transport system substrate-binding protein
VSCFALTPCTLLLSIGGASAHPHVWVTVKCRIIFDEGGSVTELLQSWSFDEMTSAFTTMVMTSRNGNFTREELAASAREQIVALSKHDFFTTVRVGNESQLSGTTSDYWLEFDGKLLTLHFSLPLNPAVPPAGLTVEIYDPSYFVDMRFADENPVEMILAPNGCASSIARQTWTQTANKIFVTCHGRRPTQDAHGSSRTRLDES